MEITQEYLENNLPSGSGFDYVWEIEEKKDKFVCRSSYTVYTEHGFRDGQADFLVKIDKKDWKKFKLHFCGYRSQYLSHKYLLHEYMEDTIYESLEGEYSEKD